MKYGHLPKISREAKQRGAFYSECQVCGRRCELRATGNMTEADILALDAPEPETYWRHIPLNALQKWEEAQR